MEPPTAGNERLRELLAECLARLERDGSAALEPFLAEHPEHSEVLRRRLALLRGAGVVEAARQAPADPVPERLGPFRLRERLGSGGMGVVYRAEQEPLGRSVALKLIRPEHLYFPASRERFRREVEAVSRLEHPGIVRVFTVGEEQGIPYFAMEHVPGLSLADLMQGLQGIGLLRLKGVHALRVMKRAGEVPAEAQLLFGGSWVEFAFRVVLQAAKALQHAHERGVLHRDIKPQNLMLRPDGRVVLLDFGLARADGAVPLTRSGAHLGSLPYMAPEQVRGAADAVDERTDVYALGVTLYELLTLREAFGGDSEEATRQRIVRGDCPSLLSVHPRIPRDAAIVCQTAMQAEPEHRYASAAELARDVQSFLELEPVAAAPPSTWQRVRLLVRRHPAGSLAVVLAFLLVVVAPGAFALQRSWALGLARQQESVAKESVRLALSAVDRMLTRVADHWIADEPRSERVRRELLVEARAMYQQILGVHGSDPRVERELARVSVRLGGLQSSLNEFAEAEASYRQGVAMFERLDSGEEVSQGAAELAMARAELAKILRQTARLDEAERVLRSAIAALERCHRALPGDRGILVRLLATRCDLGVVLYRAGRQEAAEAHVTQVIADVAMALAAHPGHADLIRLAAEMERLRGLLAMNRGDREAAVAHFRAGMAVLEARMKDAGPNEELRPQLAQVMLEAGGAVVDPHEGLLLLQRALSFHDALVAQYPGRSHYMYSRAGCLGQLAEKLMEVGRRPEATEALQRAIRDGEKLLAGAAHLVDYKGSLSLNQMTLAVLNLDQGDTDGAQVLADAAARHAVELVAAAPTRANHQAELARARYTQALVAAAREDHETEWAGWQDAIRIGATAVALSAEAPHHRVLLRFYVEGAARHVFEQRGLDALVVFADELAGYTAPRGMCLFHGARLLARAATVSARRSRAEGGDTATAKSLLARTLVRLEEAVAAGFDDDAALRTEGDLGVVRRDPKFEGILGKLRK